MPVGRYRTSGVSVYGRADRNVYYLSYADPLQPHRYRVQEATPFRKDDPEGLRKAHSLAQEKAASLRLSDDAKPAECWEVWVLSFIKHQYRDSPLTLRNYLGAWRWLALYLITVSKVRVPRALTYEHIRAYHKWRIEFRKASGKRVSSNTAIYDIKVLRLVMHEAVNRGYASHNPALRVRIPKERIRHARELLAHELALIESKLPLWASARPSRAWMPVAYRIARYQGCRLRETRLNLATQVDLRSGVLTFVTKGHKKGDGETTAMHPKLRPLFADLIARGEKWTLDYGDRPSIQWRSFFNSIGLRDAWFHCLRSTVITEMARAGIPISQAMRYVLHASEEIHRAYQRLTVGDLGAAANAIGGAAVVADSNIRVAIIAELVRGGMCVSDAMAKVLHATAASANPLSAVGGGKPASP